LGREDVMEELRMDAIALLKEDHAKAKKLMAELEQTTERATKTREQKWTKLLKELTIHEDIEGEIFYPALIEHPKRRTSCSRRWRNTTSSTTSSSS
jgi:Hemerythrin HHE cation binding domain